MKAMKVFLSAMPFSMSFSENYIETTITPVEEESRVSFPIYIMVLAIFILQIIFWCFRVWSTKSLLYNSISADNIVDNNFSKKWSKALSIMINFAIFILPAILAICFSGTIWINSLPFQICFLLLCAFFDCYLVGDIEKYYVPVLFSTITTGKETEEGILFFPNIKLILTNIGTVNTHRWLFFIALRVCINIISNISIFDKNRLLFILFSNRDLLGTTFFCPMGYGNSFSMWFKGLFTQQSYVNISFSTKEVILTNILKFLIYLPVFSLLAMAYFKVRNYFFPTNEQKKEIVSDSCKIVDIGKIVDIKNMPMNEIKELFTKIITSLDQYYHDLNECAKNQSSPFVKTEEQKQKCQDKIAETENALATMNKEIEENILDKILPEENKRENIIYSYEMEIAEIYNKIIAQKKTSEQDKIIELNLGRFRDIFLTSFALFVRNSIENLKQYSSDIQNHEKMASSEKKISKLKSFNSHFFKLMERIDDLNS